MNRGHEMLAGFVVACIEPKFLRQMLELEDVFAPSDWTRWGRLS